MIKWERELRAEISEAKMGSQYYEEFLDKTIALLKREIKEAVDDLLYEMVEYPTRVWVQEFRDKVLKKRNIKEQ